MKSFFIILLLLSYTTASISQAQNKINVRPAPDSEITISNEWLAPSKSMVFDDYIKPLPAQVHSRQLFDMYIHYGIVNGDDKAFVYNFNTLFGPTDSFQMSYAAVVIDNIKGFTDFDDPYGTITDIGTEYPSNLVITIDSVFVRCTHENNSGLYDKFQLQLVSTNSNGVPTGNALWQQTDSFDVTLSPSGNWLGTNAAVFLEYAPNYTTSPGQKVAMVFNYFDPSKMDSLGLRATHVYDAATGRAFRSDYRNSFFRRYPNTPNISRNADWGYGNPVGSQGWVTWQNWNIFARIHFEYNTSASNPEALVQNITLFPVPVADRLRVNYDVLESGTITYELCDITGRVVLSENTGLKSVGKHQSELDVTGLSNGIYALNWYHNHKPINTAKIIIGH